MAIPNLCCISVVGRVRLQGKTLRCFFVGRRIFFVAMIALAAGCTSTSGSRVDTDRIGLAASQLSACGGVRVSNAPSLNSDGSVRGYHAVQSVRGVSLLSAPVTGCLSSGFGQRRGGAGATHKGIDIYTGTPRPVAAAGDGTVTFTDRQRGYGRIVIIDHGNSVETRYAHLSEVEPAIRVGARVRQGMVIGLTGKTGNATATHLHYEILIKDRQRDPLDFAE